MCGEKGLSAAGTADELRARLQESDTAPAPNTPDPVVPQKPAVTETEVQRQWRKDALEMKKHLDAQPKVNIMIPHEPGVQPEVSEKIPFVVNLNGYRMEIPRGRYVDVPKQVAEVVRERLESEGKIGRSSRVDADPRKVEALA